MVLEPTWLECPDIQGFRTCFKSSVSQLEPIENPDFLNPLKVKKSAIKKMFLFFSLSKKMGDNSYGNYPYYFQFIFTVD